MAHLAFYRLLQYGDSRFCHSRRAIVAKGKTMSEHDLQNAIFDLLVYNGWLVVRINSGAAVGANNGIKRFIRFVTWQVLGMGKQSAGVSDLLAFRDGVLLAIEVKRPGKKASDAQREFLQAVRDRDGMTLVADSVESVEPYAVHLGREAFTV